MDPELYAKWNRQQSEQTRSEADVIARSHARSTEIIRNTERQRRATSPVTSVDGQPVNVPSNTHTKPRSMFGRAIDAVIGRDDTTDGEPEIEIEPEATLPEGLANALAVATAADAATRATLVDVLAPIRAGITRTLHAELEAAHVRFESSVAALADIERARTQKQAELGVAIRAKADERLAAAKGDIELERLATIESLADEKRMCGGDSGIAFGAEFDTTIKRYGQSCVSFGEGCQMLRVALHSALLWRRACEDLEAASARQKSGATYA